MPKKKKSNNGNIQMAQLVNLLQKATVAPTKRKRKRRSNPSVNSNEGMITLQRCELITSIRLRANAENADGQFVLEPASFAFLKGLAASFDRAKWNYVKIYYKPAVGTTYGGLVSFGMDWDLGNKELAREKISGLTPNCTVAAWADSEKNPLVLPPARLQSRTWYTLSASANDFDRSPGIIHYAISGTAKTTAQTIGELWVSYSIVMQGTNPA